MQSFLRRQDRSRKRLGWVRIMKKYLHDMVCVVRKSRRCKIMGINDKLLWDLKAKIRQYI